MNTRIDDIIRFNYLEKQIDGVIISKEEDLLIIEGLDSRAYQCYEKDVTKLLGRVTRKETKEVYDKKGYSNPELKDSIEFEKWKAQQKKK